MDRAFQQAINPTPHRVLGLNLKPFTLGHRFLMAKHESAFITDDIATIEDLILSVFICAQDWKSAEKLLARPLTCRLLIWFWSLCFRRTIFQLEFSKFRQYLTHGEACPKALPRDTRETGSPSEWYFLALCRSELHMDREEAFATPITEINAQLSALAEAKHGLQLESTPRMESLWEYAFAQWDKRDGRKN